MTITKFRLVCLDETSSWDNDIVCLAGLMFGVYLYDANRAVHCCEITPSYELYPVGNYPLVDLDVTDDGESSDLDNILRENIGEICYFHCSTIDALPPCRFYDLQEEEIGEDETWEDVRNRNMEYVQGNECLTVPKGLSMVHSATLDMVSPALNAYLASALWSSPNEKMSGNMEDHFDVDDFAASSANDAKDDIKQMLVKAAALFVKYPVAEDVWDAGQLGHDLCLTRNRHGTGFWDRVSSGHPAHGFGREMTEYAHQCGSADLYVGDDKKVYFS